MLCFSDITTKGTPNKPFVMSEQIGGGDSGTLQVALQFVYLQCIEQQHKVVTQQLMSLVSLADYLHIDSLAKVCKILMHKHLDNVVKSKVIYLYSVLLYFLLLYITNVVALIIIIPRANFNVSPSDGALFDYYE